MNLFVSTSRRPLRAVAVALAVGAIAAPAAQAGADGSLDPSIPLMTEHSASQLGSGPSGEGGKYGPPDPWLNSAIQSGARSVHSITEHSAGQNGVQRQAPVRSSAGTTSSRVDSPSGFSWRDAGIGAVGALGLVLIAAGSAFAVRKRAALAHVHS
jgi:hypothetical protein